MSATIEGGRQGEWGSEDQAFIDFMCPSHEKADRIEAGKAFATTIEGLVASQFGETNNGFSQFALQCFVYDTIDDHLRRRVDAAKRMKEALTYKQAINGDFQGHLDALVEFVKKDSVDDPISRVEDIISSVDTSDTPIDNTPDWKASPESWLKWVEKVWEEFEAWYETPEGQAAIVHDERLDNIRFFLWHCPGGEFFFKAFGLVGFPKFEELARQNDVEPERLSNDLLSFVIQQLRQPERLADYMYKSSAASNHNDKAITPETIHGTALSKHIQLYGGKGYAVGIHYEINEADLMARHGIELRKAGIEPKPIWFVTHYSNPDPVHEYRNVDPGAEVTYELHPNGQVMFYYGTPQYPGLRYHPNRKPGQTDNYRRLPMPLHQVELLTKDLQELL